MFVLLLAPAVAPAQPRGADGAERHYRAGVEAYTRRRFDVAATEFRAAYELTHDPALLFNLGSALASDGQRDAAVEALRDFLRASPDAPNRAAVEARLRELAPPPVAAPSTPPTPPIVMTRPAPPPPAPRSPWPAAGAVLGGVGLVAAAVGVGLYLDVDAQYDRCAQTRCPREEQPRGQDAASVGLLWGGGALALAGLVTFVLAPRRVAAPASRAYLLPTPRGLAIGGVF
jgi:tetratricopeptide (TPR) repeat protein